jgi:Tfp pilus assembly protein PilV
MPRPEPTPPTASAPVPFARLVAGAGRRLSEEGGFSLVEVLVSAVIVVSLGAVIAIALVTGAYTTSDQRHHSQAGQIAQEDQDRLKGLSSAQLNNIDTPQQRTVVLDGTTYTVSSTATFLSSTGGASCGSTGAGAAAYYQVVSTVNWASNHRTPVVSESLITPPAGGTLLTQVKDQTGAPLSGVGVSASGPDSASDTTGVNGCTVFAALDPGDYTLTLTDPGYVEPDTTPSPIAISATVTGTGTSTPSSGNPVTLALAGTMVTNFTANSGALTNQQAEAVSWYGAGSSNSMSTFKSKYYGAAGVQGTTIPSSGSITLFPFAFTGPSYANNYQVWAGPCQAMRPPTGVDTVTAGPGSSQTLAVAEPAINLQVKTGSTRVKPDHLKITFNKTGTGLACSDAWRPAIASDAATNVNGVLASPGQPFVSTATTGSTASASGYTGYYTICADYNSRSVTTGATQVTNTNFASATPVTLTVPTSGATSLC